MPSFNHWLDGPLWTAMTKDHPGSPKQSAYEELRYCQYQLPINLLSFFSLGKWHPKWIYPVKILGLPLSVSHPGIMLKEETTTQALAAVVSGFLKQKPRGGLRVIFNMPYHHAHHAHHANHAHHDHHVQLTSMGLVPVKTLPTTVLNHNFSCFGDYLNALRAPYRYRLHKTLAPLSSNVTRREIDPKDFDHSLYQLYEAVYARSEYPLEKATHAYFRDFPAAIIGFYDTDLKTSDPGDPHNATRPLGFYQYLIVDNCFYFVFCGLDYAVLHSYNTYVLMLADMLQTAIDLGCAQVDFGQTTELMKMKLGFVIEERLLYVYHPNPLVRTALKWLAPKASYKLPPLPELHVFKSDKFPQDPTRTQNE